MCERCVELEKKLESAEAELKRLGKINKAYEDQIAESAAVYAERDRLREAVEWAAGFEYYPSRDWEIADFKAELRRRAKEG